MKLKFKSFADPGNYERERIVFTVDGDVDVGKYALLRSKRATSGSVTSGQKVAYWFPDKEVEAGDLVVVYTRKGVEKEKPISNGRTAHFFYWGLNTAAWTPEDNHAAVLLSVDNWVSHYSNE